MADYYNENRFLSKAEMEVNAAYLTGLLRSNGWSDNAIAAMLGNFQTESTINPGLWQGGVVGAPAYGLAQWDPHNKYLNWCAEQGLEPDTMEAAVARIEWELENNQQYIPTSAYPLSFSQFKTSNIDVFTLAMAFLKNYERPKDQNQPQRGYQAQTWYTFITGGLIPDVPIPPRPWEVGDSMSLMFYLKKF